MKRNEEVYRRVPLATEGKIRPNIYHIRVQGIYTLARYGSKSGVIPQGIYTSDTIVCIVRRGAWQGLEIMDHDFEYYEDMAKEEMDARRHWADEGA